MKKSLILPLLFFTAFSLFAKNDVPEWKTNLNSVYPDSKYIARNGYGSSPDDAKIQALADISNYFNTTVTSSVNTTLSSVSSETGQSETRSLLSEASIKSNVNLFGVEYTEPYYSKKEKLYYCAAFIEREKAWTQYKPNVEQKKNITYGFYNKAQDSDPLSGCKYYAKAWESSKDFFEAVEFARILTPAKAKAYDSDCAVFTQIPSLMLNAKQQCSMTINVEGDFGNQFTQSLIKVFSGLGFSISKKAENASYTVKAKIDNNAVNSGEIVAIYPTLELSLLSKNGTPIYSYSAEYEKQAAYSLETAQNRGYKKYTAILEEDLPKDFNSSN